MTPDYVALVKRMLAAVESNDIEGYLGFFAPDAEYVTGNSGPVTGTDAIRAAAANSVQNVQSVTHEVHNMFAPGDGVVIFDSDVTYARKDGKTIRIPVWRSSTSGATGFNATRPTSISPRSPPPPDC